MSPGGVESCPSRLFFLYIKENRLYERDFLVSKGDRWGTFIPTSLLFNFGMYDLSTFPNASRLVSSHLIPSPPKNGRETKRRERRYRTSILMILMSSSGRSLYVRTFSILCTTSSPWMARPKMVCFLSNHGCFRRPKPSVSASWEITTGKRRSSQGEDDFPNTPRINKQMNRVVEKRGVGYGINQ